MSIESDLNTFLKVIEVTFNYHFKNFLELSGKFVGFFIDRFLEDPLPWIGLGLWSCAVTLVFVYYLFSRKNSVGLIGFGGLIIGILSMVALVFAQNK